LNVNWFISLEDARKKIRRFKYELQHVLTKHEAIRREFEALPLSKPVVQLVLNHIQLFSHHFDQRSLIGHAQLLRGRLVSLETLSATATFKLMLC
jgi:hypothetical protein